ncbi:MAG: gliding motility-associated C-terminal domain-containing protein, partial [Bacteroidales bacterium]|nr:gliding motility-associated C-terminal domain-containing protein [Bacteroidales bacterium]
IENNSTPADSYFEWYLVTHDDFGNMRVLYSSTEHSPVFRLEEAGTYSILLKATTPDGCKDSVRLWNYVTVNEQPIAAFAADPEISLISESLGNVEFINQVDPAFVPQAANWSYYWDFGDGNTDSTYSPTHTYSSWGDYDVTLTVQSSSGCKSEISHTVVVEQDLIFPNVITPNGDNINDVFAIENLNTNVNAEDPDGYRNNRLQVFDRWGKKVYDAKNYDTYAKDGQIHMGEKVFDANGLSDGVYYYSFHYKGKAKTITFNGSITIVR